MKMKSTLKSNNIEKLSIWTPTSAYQSKKKYFTHLEKMTLSHRLNILFTNIANKCYDKHGKL